MNNEWHSHSTVKPIIYSNYMAFKCNLIVLTPFQRQLTNTNVLLMQLNGTYTKLS